MDRSSCWSITINNPEDEETQVELPAGWKLQGQFEEGKEGTRHFQGMLTTPQVRFSAVKKVFKRAHIEIARNRQALSQYVKKEETRVGEFQDRQSDIPTLWDYSKDLASRFDDEEYARRVKVLVENDCINVKKFNEVYMEVIDGMVKKDIEEGKNGVEYIAINPMFRSAWSRFGRSMVIRAKKNLETQSIEEDGSSVSQEGRNA